MKTNNTNTIRGVKEAIDEQGKASPIIARSAGEYMETAPPKRAAILENILYKGDEAAIIGKPKVGKSLFALQLALSVASGRDFLDFRTDRPRRVLLAQFEMPSECMHERIRTMTNSMRIYPGEIGDNLMLVNGRGRAAGAWNHIFNLIEEYGIELVIFDPLHKIIDGSDRLPEHVNPVLKRIDRITAQTGAALAYVHGDVKSTDKSRPIKDRGSGSFILGSDCDISFFLREEKDNMATIVETLGRYNTWPYYNSEALFRDGAFYSA